MHNYLKIAITGLIIALSGAASICYWFIPSTPDFRQGPVEQITLGIAKEPLAALAMIAEKEGFFTEYGLDVTIKNYKGGKQALIEGILSGETDLATSADAPIVFNSFNAEDFKVIATIGSSEDEPKIIARKNKGISTPSDLSGKNILTKKGSAVHYFLSVFLTHSSIPEADINLYFTKSGSAMSKALINGEIDAFSHREPFIGQAKSVLGDNAIIFSKPGIYKKTFNLVSTSSAIKTKPKAIKRLLAALLAAEQFALENPDKSIDITSQYIGSVTETLALIWPNMRLRVSLDQSLITTMESQARWVIKNKFIKNSEMTNYLNYISIDLLQDVNPDVIGIYTQTLR